MIYAAKLLLEKDIPFIFYLLGPDTEEPEYAQECRDLIQQLGLKEHVIMTGRVNIKDYLKQTDILVLTSISEGQPLAMLEGMASGLPWVVTDVGSCKELIYGQDEDPYGQCGFVVPPVSPEQVATYLEWYYRHPESIQQFGNNGRNRIEAYYQLSGVVDSYRKLYLERVRKHGRYRISITKIISGRLLFFKGKSLWIFVICYSWSLVSRYFSSNNYSIHFEFISFYFN